jgi:hypothetical protein
MPEPIVYLYTSNDMPVNATSFKLFIKSIAKGAKDDFILTNKHTIGRSAKFAGGILASSHFAKETGTLTPIAWALRRFGPLPLEFTKSGNLRIFTLSAGQRLSAIAVASIAKFIIVTIAYEGGVLIGSVANQFMTQETKTAIGATMYSIICEEGWKDLWRHPFGYGITFGPKGERLINY